jgi:hypothetical protein
VFPSVECGGEWHWVHNQLPSGVSSGTLTVLFEGMAPIEVESSFNGSVLHYFLDMEGPATLLAASDDVVGGMLVLSHWPSCNGTTTTTGETTTSTGETTTTTEVSGTTVTTAEATTTTTGGVTTTTVQNVSTTTSDSGDLTGTLIVVKRTIPAGAPGEFTIVITAEAGGETWVSVLSDGESVTLGDLQAGIYAVTEMLPVPTETQEWTLDSIGCDDGSPADAVSLEADETVTCEVVNELTEVRGTTVTTVPPVTATTLPFTGGNFADLALIGMALAATGLLLRSLTSSRREHLTG